MHSPTVTRFEIYSLHIFNHLRKINPSLPLDNFFHSEVRVMWEPPDVNKNMWRQPPSTVQPGKAPAAASADHSLFVPSRQKRDKNAKSALLSAPLIDYCFFL